MAALSTVGGRDERATVGPPRGDDAIDGFGCEVGAVGENDDGGLGAGTQLLEAGGQRGPRAALPARARDDRRRRLERVRARDDDDLLRRSSCVSRSSTSGSSRRCFGVPNRDASPAASTTAAMLTVPRP